MFRNDELNARILNFVAKKSDYFFSEQFFNEDVQAPCASQSASPPAITGNFCGIYHTIT